jgi:hypothetical protein
VIGREGADNRVCVEWDRNRKRRVGHYDTEIGNPRLGRLLEDIIVQRTDVCASTLNVGCRRCGVHASTPGNDEWHTGWTGVQHPIRFLRNTSESSGDDVSCRKGTKIGLYDDAAPPCVCDAWH